MSEQKRFVCYEADKEALKFLSKNFAKIDDFSIEKFEKSESGSHEIILDINWKKQKSPKNDKQ